MDLLINLLGLLGLICITLVGILASGYLAARRMRPATKPDASTDSTERNTES